MRTRWLRRVAAGTVVFLAAGAFGLWPQRGQITFANFHRIQEGMSRAEVEAILDGPPGDYRTARTTYGAGSSGADLDTFVAPVRGHIPLDADGSRVQGNWLGNEGLISVNFEFGVAAKLELMLPNGSGRKFLQCKYFSHTVTPDPSPVDNFLWHAKRLWRRWHP